MASEIHLNLCIKTVLTKKWHCISIIRKPTIITKPKIVHNVSKSSKSFSLWVLKKVDNNFNEIDHYTFNMVLTNALLRFSGTIKILSHFIRYSFITSLFEEFQHLRPKIPSSLDKKGRNNSNDRLWKIKLK